ncbi:transposase, partial [Planomonospora parontospora]|uniref:transposase n=1 Tax=Planomonospora parontospora TaxID=58119 RepID=UPI00166F8618
MIGAVASFPTVWRALKEIDEAALRRIERARAAVRRHVWALLAARPEGFPWARVDEQVLDGWTVIDTDGSIVVAPSDKEGAHGTYKGTYGHHGFVAVCDNTGEELAQLLHPGNTGANDATVNIDLLTRAVAQIPGAWRKKVLIRVDGAGFSHALLEWIAGAGGRTSPSYRWEYSVGWAFTEREQDAVELVDARGLWQAATGPGGESRPDAFVADVTGLLGDLSAWPSGHRVIVRKEPLHPRYARNASPYEKKHGMRYQAFATNTA